MPTPTSQPVPPDMHTLTPHLTCANALQAIDFYVQAFGAEVRSKLMAPGGGKLMHAMLKIGDSPLMMADEFPEAGCAGPRPGQGSPVVLHLYVPDVDAAMQRALDAGARVIMPATDMFWGDRYGQLEDPFGHRWSVATRKYDMTPEEIERGMNENCGGQ